MAKANFDIARYQPFYTPLAILLGGIAIAVAIFATGGFGGSTGSPTLGEEGSPFGAQTATVSVDDDPVLGDSNAPVTIVEFSDYECPYCKSFRDETLPQIKEVYIDTGKVKFVYRDFPLPFHDPAATKEALAANCARDQGGDEAYFGYHDGIYSRTAGDGEGMKEADYAEVIKGLGLDVPSFNDCLSTGKFKDEIQGDLSYVESLPQDYPEAFPQGIGTPTFFIGKSDPSGTFEGRVIAGAFPFEEFQRIIDELLSE